MDDSLTYRDERSAGISITIGLRGRIDSSAAENLPGTVLEALRPETRKVVVDFSGVIACDDSVADALVLVETALIDEGCFLELVGSGPGVAKVLCGAGLAAEGEGSATPEDLIAIDRLVHGASGRADRAAAAALAVLQLAQPDMCNIQIFDRSDESLKISTHHGFQEPFLTYFARVADDSSACGAAMGAGDMVVVEDVANCPIFVGTAGLDIMLEAGARAVESMPYFDPAGQLGGIISMHHRTPGRRPKQKLMLLRLIAGRLGAVWR
ncbi:MAG: hypothetical protein QOE09_130 [Ilumatobacteraceae bacterium]